MQPTVADGKVGSSLDEIVIIHMKWALFWPASGWAPPDAAALLSRAAFYNHVSMSRWLRRHVADPTREEEIGQLIAGWALLGSLVESDLIVFLSVHVSDYQSHYKLVQKAVKSPDENRFKVMNEFCRSIAWHPSESARWFTFCELARDRRNGIHAFEARPMGTMQEFREAVVEYSEFLISLDATLPYP